MKRLGLKLAGCLGLVMVATASPDPERVATFEYGNQLYEAGQFVDAIEAYRPLRTNTPTLALRFNLGNAYFKSGQIGEAIAEYRLAERLAPRDPDVRANLNFARERVEGPTLQPGWVQQRTSRLTTGEWSALATATIWIVLALLIIRQLQPKSRKPLLSWTIVAGTLAVIVGVGAHWTIRLRAETRIAVVTQRDAVMRLGPFEASQSAADLKNGAELRVLDRKQDWIQVTTDHRQLGWVPVDAVRILQP